MRRRSSIALILRGVGMLLVLSGCTEGIDDYPDAAMVSGWVFADETRSQGVPGVAILLESDPQSEVAYDGPDRWCFTGENGHFEGTLYLGSDQDPATGGITYRYVRDVAVSYYYRDMMFSWEGVTVQAGGNFICPPVSLTQFSPIGSGGGG